MAASRGDCDGRAGALAGYESHARTPRSAARSGSERRGQAVGPSRVAIRNASPPLFAMAALAFLQIDALVPLPGASDVKEGFTRVPLTLCPAFSAQARALSRQLHALRVCVTTGQCIYRALPRCTALHGAPGAQQRLRSG